MVSFKPGEKDFLKQIQGMMNSRWSSQSVKVEIELERNKITGLLLSLPKSYNEYCYEHKASEKFVKEFMKWLNVPKPFWKNVKSMEIQYSEDLKHIFTNEFENYFKKKLVEMI